MNQLNKIKIEDNVKFLYLNLSTYHVLNTDAYILQNADVNLFFIIFQIRVDQKIHWFSKESTQFPGNITLNVDLNLDLKSL